MATELPQEADTLQMTPGELSVVVEHLATKGHNFLQACAQQLQKMKELNILSEEGVELLQIIPNRLEDPQDSLRRAMIAFVGETGNGKSTLLNALLDYDEIAPTSGSSACTSAAVEFSSRTSEMNSRFHAIVEYVSYEEFEEELQILHQEIRDRGGTLNEDEIENEDTLIGFSGPPYEATGLSMKSFDAAQDKLRALFPGFEEDDLPGVGQQVRELYDTTQVLQGGVQVIETNDEVEFCDQIRELVSSGNKTEEDELVQGLWPLIKVVKIYLDAPVLQTGAILVDLPGIQDSNAARTAVVNQYLGIADQVIIISQLSRAQDREPTARLARAEYIKQLEFAGKSTITVVCTWCDVYTSSDARRDFRGIPGFSEKYQNLSNKTKELSTQERRASSRAEIVHYRTEKEIAQRKYCQQILEQVIPKRLSSKYRSLFGGNIQVKTFLVSARRYQELRDTNFDDDEADMTRIPQLREYCMWLPVRKRAYGARRFIESKVLKVFREASLFLMNSGIPLSPEVLDSIRVELQEETETIRKDLGHLQAKYIGDIKSFIDNLIAEVEKHSKEARNNAGKVIQQFRDKNPSVSTLRALCRRNGTWKVDGAPEKDLNHNLLERPYTAI
ncbi:hypothetical protein TWF481_003827 [Arthrobotrys musiformis]|uniref:Dynamin N-terminal domain-containing protein n=1 Tax=Arthrobotrys musiformis TaxID=47236 RepID=A0AAV9WHX4_9PEZI